MNIDAAYTRWSDRYDSDRNLTRDLDASVTATVLAAPRFAMVARGRQGGSTGARCPMGRQP